MKTTRRRRSTQGVTLLELLVALAILGVMTSLVAAAWSPPPMPPVGESRVAVLGSVSILRRTAIANGKAARAADSIPVRALPDGQVLGAANFGLERLSGRRLAVPLGNGVDSAGRP